MKHVLKAAMHGLGVNVHPFPSDRHLALDYPVSQLPRYGYGRPPHQGMAQLLEQHRAVFAATLRDIAANASVRDGISVNAAAGDALLPNWNNGWLPALDAAMLMHVLTTTKPKRYFEIGSGNSTLFARHAIAHAGGNTQVTSLDPEPRRGIDQVCDRVIRQPLENVDQATFDDLEAGDVLFFDGSHRTFTDSDVTVFFLETLPRLNAGVQVQIHDIFWPADYPPVWGPRHYSEQYMLGVYLLAVRPELMMASAFVSNDAELEPVVASLTPGRKMLDIWGTSMWFRTPAQA